MRKRMFRYDERDAYCCNNDKQSWDTKFDILDLNCHHRVDDDILEQDAKQVESTIQKSNELIVIKDSCDVKVKTTDTRAAVNLQAALQFAIAAVIDISVSGSDDDSKISQKLLQKIQVKQIHNQKTVIENSKGVKVKTKDTDLSVNIQLLAQILAALVARLDVK
ncbi:spore coat protein [Aneurinibacillus aneurinilyticus]|uniref:Spore coat protein n=2 Tax=Aneurinibacillus aneurinilyticus TaxID=1391 RepID=A0A848D3F8_ANEAE|nr:spore coat protein [Aneurinibacillus aneurinilyticus]MCI1695459.1 spore coat protein [Aneurinibacillus aneurinilyticus]MED0673216.1 spore coat protein [Aneurinibacillus aneurinilyticus]MED0706768.1 spore coat protein [Aneurinibacillus aneurinilyticus]MED0725731.1 spore coat protein [Aneurinibacillus aneurinilyticus]MED0734616.1 spore coat protein [Aneurinibacillus aneurinilyticus]